MGGPGSGRWGGKRTGGGRRPIPPARCAAEAHPGKPCVPNPNPKKGHCIERSRALSRARTAAWHAGKRAGRKVCAVAGCEKPAESRTWCTGHYGRWRKTGDVHADKPLGPWNRGRVQGDYWQIAKAQIDAIKTATGCTDCGDHFEDCPEVLAFDHMPGSVKLFPVSAFDRHTWAEVVEEMAKCEVVCANCHMRRTVKRRRKV